MNASATDSPAGGSDAGFVHLHVHTEFSKQDGLARLGDLVAAARADGQTALAMTDHGNLGGAWRFVKTCKANGIKPILGIEAYMALVPDGTTDDGTEPEEALAWDDPKVRFGRTTRMGMDAESGKAKRNTNYHLTILASNETGWRNLCAIHNAAEESFFHKPLIDFALLKEHGEGLIVLSGCLGGPVASHVAAARRELKMVDHDWLCDRAESRALAAAAAAVDGEALDEATRVQVATEARAGVPAPVPVAIEHAQARHDEQMATARANLDHLVECVGAENVYVEVMEHGLEAEGWDHIVTLARLAQDAGVRVVATNDSHYVSECDCDAHDSWLVNGERARGNDITKNDPDRWRFNGEGYWLRSAQQMRALFAEKRGWQRACDETLRLAERIDPDVIPFKALRLPRFPVPRDATEAWEAGEETTITDANGVEHRGRVHGRRAYRSPSAFYLHSLVRAGAKERYGALSEEVKARLAFEFDVITSMGLEDYFLIVGDVLAWARSDRGLPTPEHPDGEPGAKKPIRVGPGRGSAAGSAVSYALRIVMVEPLSNGLLFERFLDVARIGMPDIDVDFEAARRDEVYAYLAARYGDDYVARIGAFQVAKTKRAIKDAARVYDLTALGEDLTKAVPVHQGSPQKFSLLFEEEVDPETGQAKQNPEGQPFRDLVAANPSAARIVELARAFEGVAAGESIHAAGVIISDEPLTDLIPMRRLRDKKTRQPVGVPVALWDGKDIDSYGMLKLDALGLTNLDVIAAAVDNIALATGEHVDPDMLPDPDTKGDPRVDAAYALLRAGQTQGIFQLESAGITELCEAIAPTEFADLSALVALYRPGPMAADMHTLYADRKNGRAEVNYDYLTRNPTERDVIASVLDETYGTCVAKGERVYSATRAKMVPIEDIEVGEQVQGVQDDGEHVTATVLARHDNGFRDTVVVRFASGDQIRVTPDHRMLTSSGWKRAGDLTNRDAVAAPWRLLDHSSSSKPVDGVEISRAGLLGYLLGDGGLTAGTVVGFYNSDPRLINRVGALASTAFPGTEITDLGVGQRNVRRIRLSGRSRGGHGGAPEGALLAWLREHGLKTPRGATYPSGVHSRDKFIPNPYLSAPESVVLPLLAGLWDCDGRVGTDHRGSSQIVYKTISPRLAADVRHLLLRMGITTTLTRCEYSNPSGTEEVAHHIAVHQHQRFVELIVPHMASVAKVEAASSLRSSLKRPRWGSTVPMRDVEGIRHRVDGSWRAWRRERGFGESNPLRDSRFAGAGLIGDLARLTGDADLTRLARSQWRRVVEVTAAPATQVFDITVDKIHNFVAEGVVVHNCAYQESLMTLAEEVAAFSPDEKNRLRKAFSKKDRPAMEALKDIFITQGAVRNVLADGRTSPAFSAATLERLWVTFDGSAEYLFNKSHSAVYGHLAFVTAYLKANWPVSYAAAVLSIVDKADRRLATLFALARDGISVLAPDVNDSAATTAPDPGGEAVRIGLGEVRDVGNNGRWIVAEREARGPFSSVRDFIERVKVPDSEGALTSKLSVTAVEALVEAGAFDSFEPRRLGLMLALRSLSGGADVEVPDAEWSTLEQTARQRIRLGVAVGEHPMDVYAEQLADYEFALREDRFGNLYGGTPVAPHEIGNGHGLVVTMGVLTAWSERATRKGGKLANFTIEGSEGSISGTAFDRIVRKAHDAQAPVEVGSIVAVAGKMRSRVVVTTTTNDDGEEVEESREVSELIAEDIEPVPVNADPQIHCLERSEDDVVVLAEVIPIARNLVVSAELGKRRAKSTSARRRQTEESEEALFPHPSEESADADLVDFDDLDDLDDAAEAGPHSPASPSKDQQSAHGGPAADAPPPSSERPSSASTAAAASRRDEWAGIVRIRPRTQVPGRQDSTGVQARWIHGRGEELSHHLVVGVPGEKTPRKIWGAEVGDPVATDGGDGAAFRYRLGCTCECAECQQCPSHEDDSPCPGKQGSARASCNCPSCPARQARRGQFVLVIYSPSVAFGEEGRDQDYLTISPEDPSWEPRSVWGVRGRLAISTVGRLLDGEADEDSPVLADDIVDFDDDLGDKEPVVDERPDAKVIPIGRAAS